MGKQGERGQTRAGAGEQVAEKGGGRELDAQGAEEARAGGAAAGAREGQEERPASSSAISAGPGGTQGERGETLAGTGVHIEESGEAAAADARWRKLQSRLEAMGQAAQQSEWRRWLEGFVALLAEVGEIDGFAFECERVQGGWQGSVGWLGQVVVGVVGNTQEAAESNAMEQAFRYYSGSFARSSEAALRARGM